MHPTETKHRAIIHYNHFLRSIRKVAKIYKVGKSTLCRWLRQSIHPQKSNRNRVRLYQTVSTIVERAIASQPYSTADDLIREICSTSGAKVSRSTVYRSLKHIRHSYKRSSRSREHEAVPWNHPFLLCDAYQGDPIAVDESSFYWNDFPRMGWGPKGKRVRKARPTDRKRVSLLLAVGKEGVIHFQTVTGGVKGTTFADFVSALPNNRPLILDNCSIHKTKEVRAVCKTKGLDLRFIPPYCPWYNPVEFCFSELKRSYRPMRLKAPSVQFVDDVTTCLANLKHHSSYFRHAEEMCARDRASRPP